MRLLPFKPRHIFALLVLLLLINTLFVPSTVAEWYSKWPADRLNTFTVPFTKRLKSFSTFIRGSFARESTNVAETIADKQRLHRQFLKLRQQLVEANQIIEQLGDTRQRFTLTKTNFLSARVASVAAGARRTMMIDVGARDGVRKGHVVGAGVDLIGRVVNTGPSTATVQLIVDRNTHLNVYVMSPVDDAEQRLVRAQLRYDVDREVFVGDVPRSHDGDNVRIGDFALPADTSWPDEARYFIVGRVVGDEKHEDHPTLLRQIVVKPQSDPTMLTNVIVVILPADNRPEGSTSR